jgi:hypothetical protein
MAFFNAIGIFKCLANPFPEPVGIIAKMVLLFISPFPISLTEPSPPTATIISYLFTLLALISIACFARSV